MEELSMDKLKEKFTGVIKGKISFEEASNWAARMMELNEQGLIDVKKERNNSELFRGLAYLSGVDFTTPSGEYFHSIKNVEDKMNKIFNSSND
jgi:hypothetical protein